MTAAAVLHLPFHNHVHELDTAQQNTGTSKCLEPEHRPGTALDSPVVLFHDVIQILVLADLDRRVAPGVEGLERGQIRPALIDRDRLGFAVLGDLFFKVALGCSLVSIESTLQRRPNQLPNHQNEVSDRD